ncbi:hypothetical protein VCUG_00366 [Vavraia culicis subsp. floridensis]|uniref:ADP,ATP carrier protein n=1 Tax=Vavraia culicis (isolate floridensis) TaxID=948595 RepID=L2GXV2_VAVCU|nr:uncharacterized protein VCUG_00366 [Vavraia culicis subsp. floridensis]ELA48128.1 hypothetical protein VCUG_00366 [Vavraia culicis subsp. floridensis]
MREDAFGSTASSLSAERPDIRKRKLYLVKVQLCAFMVYISYIMVYSSRNLLNGIIIARQSPIAKCFTVVFIILPITLVMSILVRKWLSRYSIQIMLTYALAIFCLYFLIVNPFVVYFKQMLDFNDLLIVDFVADGKIAFKRMRLFAIFLSMLTSWTITLQFSVINIYEAFVQYVLMFSMFNEIFTQKQYNGFVSIILFCETLALLTSSLISILHQQIITSVSYCNKEYVNVVFTNVIFALNFVLFLIFVHLKTEVTKEKAASVQRATIELHANTPESEYDSARDKDLGSLLRLKFVRAISVNVIALFILNEFMYISFESGVYTVAKKTFRHVTSTVIRSTDIIRFASSLLILVALFFSVPRRLIQHNWKFLAYSPCTWLIIASIFQFTMDTILKGVEGDSFQFVNNLFQSLSSSDNVHIRVWIYRIYNNFTILALIFVRILRNIGFLIAKETLTMMIDRKIRPRLRTIYDGMCPLIGKAIASSVVLFMSELFDFRDARSFSVVMLIFALVVFCSWINNTRYLVRRYYGAF